MTTNRNWLGVFSLGLVSLMAPPAIGQIAVSPVLKVDLRDAITLAHDHSPCEDCKLGERDTPTFDLTRQQRRQRLFVRIAVSADLRPVGRIGGGGSFVFGGSGVSGSFVVLNKNLGQPVAAAGISGGGARTLGGFLGLLQQQGQVDIATQILEVRRRMLTRLEADQEAGLIDIAQVDAYRQSIQTSLANLLNARITFEASFDAYKVAQLGLPPDLPIELDNSMIRQFELVDSKLNDLQTSFSEFTETIGNLPRDPTVERLSEAIDEIVRLRDAVGGSFAGVRADLSGLEAKSDLRTRHMSADQKARFQRNQDRMAERLVELQARFQQSANTLDGFRAALTPETAGRTADSLVAFATSLSSLTQEITLFKALARLEAVTVESIEISPVDALKIAHSHRLDWLNECAAVEEMWRSLAGHEKSDDVAAYYNAHRALIQAEDRMNQALRQDLRVLTQLQQNFEIQRKAVAINMRRFAASLEALTESPPEARPGQPMTALAPHPSTTLLSTLQGFSDAQNNLLAVYLHYYARRVELFQDLGIMRFDERGMWIDEPLDGSLATVEPAHTVPPDDWCSGAGDENAAAQ